jgi:predicted amidophosphoribosyltransferase
VPAKINPRKLRGPWTGGYALDVHTTSSTMIGHNAYGHAVFDTVRSPLGELLYRLKNRGDQTAIPEILAAAGEFVKRWAIHVDAIVPVPPSNTARKHQPVIGVARALSEYLGVPLCEGCLAKIKSTGQLKDVFDYAKRAEILKDAFSVDAAKTKSKRLLLIPAGILSLNRHRHHIARLAGDRDAHRHRVPRRRPWRNHHVDLE